MIKFKNSKLKILKKLNLPFLLNFSSKYNYKILNNYKNLTYKSYYDFRLRFIRHICYNYCITYNQYLYYFKKISNNNTNLLFLKLLYILESRIDNVLVNIGCFKTILQSRFYIRNKYILINNNNKIYYNYIIKINDIIYFKSKIKYILLYNLIFRYNIYIYLHILYIYNYIQIYSYNNYFLICIYNFKIKITSNIKLNNILYIYNYII
uniref:Small subunit ribosomal protein 4 n=1 Tax=Leucocytozoon caulleryi TaxID=211597 RepID=U3TRS6_LEUCU|nr:small subunit ribosomal protein 4 [Leucocytozoon caulleryi]BAN94666.1 small subunit ribosomal protein 4 [Leucocytozoon caulleryi]